MQNFGFEHYKIIRSVRFVMSSNRKRARQARDFFILLDERLNNLSL